MLINRCLCLVLIQYLAVCFILANTAGLAGYAGVFFFSQFSDESAPVYTLKIHNSSELQLGPTLNYANIFGIYAVASYCCCGIFYMLYYSDSFGSLVLSMLVVGDFHAPHERILYGMETEKFRKIK